MLEAIGNMKNLFACSVHDTNPVHFISVYFVTIILTINICSVFDTVYDSMHEMRFLILNINDAFNRKMNSVDISD